MGIFRHHKKARADVAHTTTTPYRFLAVVAIDAARRQLGRYVLETNWPTLGMVEAADLLDQARELLTQGGAT